MAGRRITAGCIPQIVALSGDPETPTALYEAKRSGRDRTCGTDAAAGEYAALVS